MQKDGECVMEVKLAKVISVREDGQAEIMFFGDTTKSEKQYPYIRNFIPENGDTVVMIRQGDSYVIIGTVVTGGNELQFAREDHTHDDMYAEAEHTHIGLTNGESGVELTSAGVLVPLKNLAAALGSDAKAFSEIYGNNVYVLTNLTVGDRTITKDSVGTSSKPFSKGRFTTVYVGSKELTEEVIEGLQNPTEWHSNSTSRKITFSGATLLPDLTGYVSLGTSGKMFASGYFQNLYLNGSAISTSDKRKKKYIKNLPEKFKEFFMKLRPVTYKYKKGTSGRSHVGFIAQDVELAMKETGITPEEFGGLVVQENGDYGLRYEEFIAIQTELIQQLYSKVEELERKVSDSARN